MNGEPSHGETSNRNRKARWPRIVMTIAAISVILILFAMAGAGMWLYEEYRPVAPEALPSRVMIGHGESVRDISQQLLRRGLIRNAFVFRLYVRYVHAEQGLQAGTYDIVPGSTIKDIVAQFRTGKIVTDTLSVTIPEGFTVDEIANRLASDRICPKAAFLRQVQHGEFTEPFLAALPKHAPIKYRLEGYLFPDTYQFRHGASAHTVVDVMLQDFQEHINKAGITSSLQGKGESLPGLITTASLIEKEAMVSSDRPLIASVIDNRLKQGMKLQIDATIVYILGHREIVTDKDLTVKDPYNTYLHTGLPPGPIASPGMPSILAALHPAHTKYLYYVAKYDGSGASYFSSTEAQHLRNTEKSQQNLKNQSK